MPKLTNVFGSKEPAFALRTLAGILNLKVNTQNLTFEELGGKLEATVAKNDTRIQELRDMEELKAVVAEAGTKKLKGGGSV